MGWARTGVAALLVLIGGCRCLLPVDEVTDSGSAGGNAAGGAASDSGLIGDSGAPAGFDGGVDAGLTDAGFDGEVDAGSSLDAGFVPDAGGDSGVAAVDAGAPTCAQVRCSPWSSCDDDAGAVCVPTVTSLRWVLPANDASVPHDTIRLAIAVQITGSADSVPIVATGAGQGSTVVTRADGGTAFGWLSFSSLTTGPLQLAAGWPGGPDASVSVNVSPANAVVLGSMTRSPNSREFQPNDPEGSGWRRDDFVPMIVWPGARLLARRVNPDASFVLVDAGTFSDGGEYLPLQNVEFDAFRGQVEVRAVTDSWEAAPQQLAVTRWRWRRVVAAPSGTLRIQQPSVGGRFAPRFIHVGTMDTATSGRLIQLDEEGMPTNGYASWDAAVSTPFLGERQEAVCGVDADGGFLLLDGQYVRFDEPIVAAGTVDVGLDIVLVTSTGRWFSIEGSQQMLRDVGHCAFDAGRPLRLISGYDVGFVISEAGEVCTTSSQGPPQVLPLRVRPMSVAGPGSMATMTSASGTLLQQGTFLGEVDGGPRNAEFIVAQRSGSFLQPPGAYTATTNSLEFWPFSGDPYAPNFSFTTAALSVPLAAPLATSPVLRVAGSERWLLTVDTAGSLRSLDGSLREQWAWRPDGGLHLQAPLGFAPSESRLGTLLLVVDGAVVAVVAEGPSHERWGGRLSWLMESGSSTSCHEDCDERALP